MRKQSANTFTTMSFVWTSMVSWWNWWLLEGISSLRQKHLESFETDTQHMCTPLRFVTSSYQELLTSNPLHMLFKQPAQHNSNSGIPGIAEFIGQPLQVTAKLSEVVSDLGLTSMNPWDGSNVLASHAGKGYSFANLRQPLFSHGTCQHNIRASVAKHRINYYGWGNISKVNTFFHQIWILYWSPRN